MTEKNGMRYCDRCGVILTKDNNKCGFELCDRCNEILEKQCSHTQGCGTCKYRIFQTLDFGYVCVRSGSEHFGEWPENDDWCDKYEKKNRSR